MTGIEIVKRISYQSIEAGARPPFGYGFAWPEFASCYTVIMPIPLNFIARWARAIYQRLVRGSPTAIDKAISTSFGRGLQQGLAMGIERGRKIGAAEFEERLLASINKGA